MGLLVALLLSLLSTERALSAATPTADNARDSAPPLVYIALGDSIASGHGLADAPVGVCERSEDGYPARVQALLERQRAAAGEVEIHHLACSGARALADETTAERISACQQEFGIADPDETLNYCDMLALDTQVQHALSIIEERPEDAEVLVSISIGINDAQWSDPIALTRLLLAPDDEFSAQAEELADTIGSGVRAQVQRLLQADIAPNDLTIVLTDYYQPFNAGSMIFSLLARGQSLAWGSGSSGEPCVGTDRDGNKHTLSCIERVRMGLQELHDSFERIARREPRVVLAPLLGRFTGHEAAQGVCGNAETDGPSWVQTNAYRGSASRPDCFHPNDLGAEQIAQIVVTAASWVQPWTFGPNAGTVTP